MRALRVDKMTYAALEATLDRIRRRTRDHHGSGPAHADDDAQTRSARAPTRCTTALGTLTGWRAEVVPGVSAIGGGSAPGVELPTWLVAIAKDGLSADALEERLRRLTPPVIARIEDDRVLLDLRTVLPQQDALLLSLLGDL